MRVPTSMRWPGKIPAGSVCSEVAAACDILPTFAKLAKAELPKRKIDGKNIWRLMSGKKDAKSPHKQFYYYRGAGLRAGQALILGAKARTLLQDRSHVTPDDIKALAVPVLRHRILPNFKAEAEGVDADKVVEKLLETVPVP